MDFRSPPSSTTAEKADTTGPTKQAACLNCRRSKTRCFRDEGVSNCRKCAQSNTECIVPEYRVGRKKGIKNKRDGLEKAVFRIEQAIKKHKTNGTHSDDEQVQQLAGLLADAQKLIPQHEGEEHDDSYQLEESPESSNQTPSNAGATENVEDQFAVRDAENPLQLLARASDLSLPSNPLANVSTTAPSTRQLMEGDQVLRDFFGPFRPSLDNSEATDPIELGLVTAEETIALFNYFYDNLAHTRWGLDPILHTPQFVQKQSTFLFTSILATSALFIPSSGAISKRLTAHRKRLARDVVENGNRSPEIVLAFMINIPWMAPGMHWSDDDTCAYMSMALSIALDSSLDKLIFPSPSELQGSAQSGRAQSDCISARKALNMDGFPDVEPTSNFGRRLLRRRERIWLALFVLDRGVCLARGRSFLVPVTPLIETCDEWHRCSMADVWDGSVVSSTVLRRDLVDLIASVKKSCNAARPQDKDGALLVQILQSMIDGFFNNWYTTWAFPATSSSTNKNSNIPPYVEILVTHGRLSIYSSVINHPLAPLAVKRFFRAAGLSSSLNVMRAAVQGESTLKSMPNNTCIMISFAACFAISLSIVGAGPKRQLSLAPSVKILIEESAGVLERIGTVTPHRNGTSALYGRHLREVVGNMISQSAPRTPGANANPVTQNRPPSSASFHQSPLYPQQPLPSQFPILPSPTPAQIYPELLQFSAMSDDQINEAINNVAGEEPFDFDAWSKMPPDSMGFDVGMGGAGMGGMDRGMGVGLDWLNWFNMEAGNAI
ncbi:hypothetical protein BJ875DRAFT_282466 [Amylocarpus encephaloides]|uniref:Zn(2)-C6 fungal-type domain-containing protein n=1 Tax=Amylocarpus encephaloides TaxID=45428 RepID=A0A9P8C5Y4_9HELO|nr:hypothetical protein BJ875DRAFT_282466 [Amylocarpus encephaloides]